MVNVNHVKLFILFRRIQGLMVKGSILTVASCITWAFCILGGVLVIIGLYVLLRGKDRDQPYIKTKEHSSNAETNAADKEEAASAEKEEA
ncbi:putative Auxin-induced protein 5NG4 [Corchorus olitorius]|uniref:Auxin-induced protein 5NG4 n=1 Tax=Corchorus olitorius TaxID=93759 RepID=A0A1R3G9C7_9ROSI|nr:putative Auxin-induced protein 5NG4 [Corchorus olitorius]